MQIDVGEFTGSQEQRERDRAKRFRNILACDLLLARLYRNHPDHAAAALAGIQPHVIDLEPPEAPSIEPAPDCEVRAELEEIQKQVRIGRIIDCVGDYFQVSPTEICGESRALRVVYPRQIAVYLSREYTFQSWNRIGRKFGKRDHTTILHSHRRITELMLTDEKVSRDVVRIRAKISQSLQ